MESNGIIDLERIVKTRAWTEYKHNRKWRDPKKMENVNMVFDWSRVSFDAAKPDFRKKPTEQTKYESNVIFKSVFKNQSDIQQNHSFKAERQTTATCTSSITKGFTKGLNVGITLAAPENIVKASVGYSKGFSLTTAKETTDQRTLTWSTEGSLAVEPKSKLIAEHQIIEEQSKFHFRTRVAIAGCVIVRFYRQTDTEKLLMVYSGSMKTILCESVANSKFETEGETVYLEMEGECNFKFGIEQHIVISKLRQNNAETQTNIE